MPETIEITQMTVAEIAYEWMCPNCPACYNHEDLSSSDVKIPETVTCRKCNTVYPVNRAITLENIIELIA